MGENEGSIMSDRQNRAKKNDASAKEKFARINNNYSANPVKWAIGIGIAVLVIAAIFCALFATGVVSIDPQDVATQASIAASANEAQA